MKRQLTRNSGSKCLAKGTSVLTKWSASESGEAHLDRPADKPPGRTLESAERLLPSGTGPDGSGQADGEPTKTTAHSPELPIESLATTPSTAAVGPSSSRGCPMDSRAGAGTTPVEKP